MIKIIAIIVIIPIISACGQADRMEATWTGNVKHCVDGVEYIQFTSGASVAYNRNGTIKTCL